MTTSWNRKDQHIHYAQMQYATPRFNGFEGMRFIHQSLSQTKVSDISLNTSIADLNLDTPFFINAMTGGSDKAKVINENLAYVAKETKLAMALGSISIALTQPDLQNSFRIVRKVNPDGIIFANLGAHHSLDNAKKVVDLVEANALQLHLNTPQELVMPEGDRDFTMWLKNIEHITTNLDVPVIVKEVGFGMAKETMTKLTEVGVSIIDVAGRGGTNFIQIENERREEKEYDYLMDWGQTTVESLLEAQPFLDNTTIISSGGIKTPLDMLKSFGLGASAVGISGEFLNLILTKGNAATIQQVQQWKEELTFLMTMIGAKQISDIKDKPFILNQELTHWCQERNISIHKKRG